MKEKFTAKAFAKLKKLGVRRSIFAVLAVAVVLCTAVVLVHPAVTLEKSASKEDTSTVASESLQTQTENVTVQSDSGARLISGKSVVYQVLFDGRWITVGSSSYSTGTVNGETCAYITSNTAAKYFGAYGYSADKAPGTSFQHSYNDIYTIYYYSTTNYVIDFQDNSIKDDSKIWLYEYNGTDAQKFRIWESDSGYSFISPLRNSGYFINVYGGGTVDGTELRLRHETDNASRWKIETDSSGRTTFANSSAPDSAYIDLPSGTVQSENQLQIWNNGGNIYWRLDQIYEWNTSTGEKTSDGYKIGLTAESNGNIICRYTPTLSDGDDIYHIADLEKLKKDGTHRLMNDISVSGTEDGSFITLTDVKSTFDLNGNTISYNPDVTDSNHTFISLGTNADFTVTDNKGNTDESVERLQSDKLYGNQAQWNSNRKYLTYYVTESDVNEDIITRTDTLVKHTVDITDVGAIESTGPNYPTQLIKLENDSAVLTVDGGRFTNPGGQHSIYTVPGSSTLNISGGYFCGTESTAKGGAIYASGNTTVSGGVIAANMAGQGAGIFYHGKDGSSTFKMTGGVISGNSFKVAANGASGDGMGAGLCCWMEDDSSASILSGGYITNNNGDYYCGWVGAGCHHGAGIYQAGGYATLTKEENGEGVFITGNYHKESGGGIGFSGQFFYMDGGVISSNVAEKGEGGGMRFQGTARLALIENGYVTNNKTLTNHDWGGGGIFVTSGNSLQIRNSLISQNHSRGFGGGVTGCPTGQLIVNDESAGQELVSAGITALYGNTADGEVLAGSDGVASAKPQDQKAMSSQVFMTSGYQDYFCALNSILTGTMLGDGCENYTGSCDYVPITLKKDETKVASSMMGMTANPTQQDIEKGINAAAVFITGNFSGTHGGGILSNGLLILGEATNATLKPGVEISMPKIFQKKTDGSKVDTEADQFNFLLLDDKVTVNGSTVSYTEENIVERLTNNDKGYLTFEPTLPNMEGSTVATYYLMEEPGKSLATTYDSTVYKIEIGTVMQQETRKLTAAKSITLTYYLVNRVKVSVVGDANETKVAGYYWDMSNDNFEGNSTEVGAPTRDTRLSLTFDVGFTNTIDDTPVLLNIVKTDGNTKKLLPFVPFTLKNADGTEIETKSTSGDTGTVVFQLEKNKNYLISETPPDGYNDYGPWYVSVDANGMVTIYEGTDNTGKKIENISFSENTNVIKNTWQLENFSGYILPATGGIGTAVYTVCGFFAIAVFVFVLLNRKKRAKI